MAKSYELLFQLTARLGPNFTKSFKNASQTMKILQSDLKGANQKLKDVAAYKKQQTAVANSKDRVTELQKEYDSLAEEIGDVDGATRQQKKELESVARALAKAKDAAADEQEKLEELKNTLKAAGVNTDSLEQGTNKLRQQYEKLERTQKKVQEINAKQEANKQVISQTKAQLGGLVGAAAAVGTAIYAGPVKKAAEFQEQMSSVAAISRAGGKELQQLSEKAKEMGAKTKFTAAEAGEAMEYMAMAGWKSEDMLGGIEGIMNLAAASGEKLGSVSDIVTDALTAFGLSASDAGHFSDVLAQASSNANTNVSMMGATFQKVAPVAGALGYSVEDMSLGIGLMANASIKAEVAGTSLKTALANMAKPTEQQAAYMERYGISLTKTDGTMKSFGEVVENLRGSLGGLSEQEQIAAATAIFGKESFAGMLAIVNASEQDYNKLTEAVYNCEGAAKQMAEKKLDNLNGSVTLAKSAFDALQVELGEMLLPTLTEGVKKFTEITNAVTTFVRENPGTVKTIAKVAAAFVGLKAGGLVAKLGLLEINGGILHVKEAFELIKGLGINNFISGLTGGFLNFKNIGGGILNYFKGIKGAAGGVSSAFGDILNGSALFTKISGTFGGITGRMRGVLTSTGAKMLTLMLKPFSALGGPLGGALANLGGIIAKSPLGTIGQVVGKGLGKITTFLAPAGNAIKTMLGPLGKLTSSIFGPMGGVVGKVLPIVGVITTVITVIQLVKNHLDEVRGFIQKTFGDGALEVFDKVVVIITNIGDTIKNVFSDGNIGAARDKIQEIFGDRGVQAFDTLVNILGKAKSAVGSVIQFVITNVVPVAENILQVLTTSVIPGIVNFIQAAAPTVKAIIGSIVDFIGEAIPIIANLIASVLPVISEVITFLQAYVLPVVGQVFSFITGVVLPAIAAAMPVVLAVVKSGIETISGIVQNLMTILSGVINFVTGVFTGNWSQAWNGIRNIFKGAVGGLGEIIKAPLRAVVSAVNTVIGGLNKLKVPDWVPGLGGKGINIPLIPGFVNGTVRTPDTFIAGEKGPELITGAANRSVFTAAQTGKIFQNMAQAQKIDTVSNVNAGMAGTGTIILNVENNPTVYAQGGDTGQVKEQLRQYDEEFLEKIRQIILSVLKELREREERVAYE